MSKSNGCLGIILTIFGFKPAGSSSFSYSATDLLSPAERSFLGVLDQVVPDDFRVFAKVRLADLFRPTSRKAWQSAFNKITSKHVDFVLCQASDMRPICAIELDDASHLSKRAKESDSFKDALFASSGIRLVRIKAQRSYSLTDVRAALFPVPMTFGS